MWAYSSNSESALLMWQCYSVAEWYQLIKYSGSNSPLSLNLSVNLTGNGLNTYAVLM
jgi:hypothetical protein